MTYPLSFVTKGGVVLGYESSHVLRGRVSIGDFFFFFVRGSVFVYEGCSEDFLYLFFLDTSFYIVIANLVLFFDIY